LGEEAPPAPPPPQQPNYAAANREAVQADIDTLPTRRRIDAAARLGTKVYDPDTGKEYDFTGLGDSALALSQAETNAASADLTAAKMLEIQRKYGSDFSSEALKQLEQADPEGFKARRSLAKQINDDLALGSSLTPEEEMMVEQQIRGGQAARGNILGPASTAQEVLGKTEFGQKLKQQRLSNASAYVFGSPLTAQYQTLSGAQQGAAPFQPTQSIPGIGVNANAGAQGSQFASNIFATQGGMYGSRLNYQVAANQQNAAANPWLMGSQMAGTAAGAAAMAMCWVAEELYGKDSEKTQDIREFCNAHKYDGGWLGDFLMIYEARGKKWADEIRKDPEQRKQARIIWDGLHKMAMEE